MRLRRAATQHEQTATAATPRLSKTSPRALVDGMARFSGSTLWVSSEELETIEAGLKLQHWSGFHIAWIVWKRGVHRLVTQSYGARSVTYRLEVGP